MRHLSDNAGQSHSQVLCYIGQLRQAKWPGRVNMKETRSQRILRREPIGVRRSVEKSESSWNIFSFGSVHQISFPAIENGYQLEEYMSISIFLSVCKAAASFPDLHPPSPTCQPIGENNSRISCLRRPSCTSLADISSTSLNSVAEEYSCLM